MRAKIGINRFGFGSNHSTILDVMLNKRRSKEKKLLESLSRSIGIAMHQIPGIGLELPHALQSCQPVSF
jgi:hypothetical protein